MSAFQFGERVIIGVTSDNFMKLSGKKEVAPYSERVKNIEDFLKREGLYRRTLIVKLDDRFGPTIIDRNIDGIVVSRETSSSAHEANRLREAKGMPKLAIYLVDQVMAKDGKPVSSTRIRKGEIDEFGEIKRL